MSKGHAKAPVNPFPPLPHERSDRGGGHTLCPMSHPVQMTGIFVLSGPQGIGKSRHAAEIAGLLGCETVIDEWNGINPLPSGALAITNSEYVMPEGGVAFQVEDAPGLDALVRALQPRAA